MMNLQILSKFYLKNQTECSNNHKDFFFFSLSSVALETLPLEYSCMHHQGGEKNEGWAFFQQFLCKSDQLYLVY